MPPEVKAIVICDGGESRMAAIESIQLGVYSRPSDDQHLRLLRVSSRSYRIVKSGLDRLCAGALIAVFAILGLVIATTVVLESEGPVFYREWRIGRGGRPFRIWKFRSMQSLRRSPPAQPDEDLLKRRTEKELKDSRITAVGGFLRRWSLEELPQLINVICGEMSLVGPRPVVDEEIALYGDLRHCYLAAKPGMSGLWQVSGRSNVAFETRVRLDAWYVQYWSLRGDFRILISTLPVVLRRIGAW